MVVHFLYWYKLATMSNKYESKNQWFWHRGIRWNEYYKQWSWCSKRYWCCGLVKTDCFCFVLSNLQTQTENIMFVSEHLNVFIYAVVCWKFCIFKYWRVIFTLLSNKLCTPAILTVNACCLTLAISHFVLLSQPLFVPCLFEKVCWKGKRWAESI